MPVARATRFHEEYSLVMHIFDRMDQSERNQVRFAVETLFSPCSNYSDIKAARSTIERIAEKYSLVAA
jgi:hypothetical protein